VDQQSLLYQDFLAKKRLADKYKADRDRLQHEVDRLAKIGDEMLDLMRRLCVMYPIEGTREINEMERRWREARKQ